VHFSCVTCIFLASLAFFLHRLHFSCGSCIACMPQCLLCQRRILRFLQVLATFLQLICVLDTASWMPLHLWNTPPLRIILVFASPTYWSPYVDCTSASSIPFLRCLGRYSTWHLLYFVRNQSSTFIPILIIQLRPFIPSDRNSPPLPIGVICETKSIANTINNLNSVVSEKVENNRDVIKAAISIATDSSVMSTLVEQTAFYAVALGFKPGIYFSWWATLRLRKSNIYMIIHRDRARTAVTGHLCPKWKKTSCIADAIAFMLLKGNRDSFEHYMSYGESHTPHPQ